MSTALTRCKFKERESIVQDSVCKPPAYFSIREVDVKPVEVTSSLIEVNITAYIYHSEGEAKNATMLIRAIKRLQRQASSQVKPQRSKAYKMNIEVSKFMREGGVPPSSAAAMATEYATMKEPGFEAIVAIAALIMVIALRRRS
jgi:hypothetical protein